MSLYRPISAYAALEPAERAFTDAIVREMESIAVRTGQPIGVMLQRGFEVPPVHDPKGMLQRDRVQYAVRERLEELARDGDLTEYRWFKEVQALGMSSMAHYVRLDENGDPTHALDTLTPEQWAAVKKLKIERKGDGDNEYLSRSSSVKVEIELYPKMDALKMLGEYAGYLAGEAPVGRADRSDAAQTLTADNAADEYQRMIE